MDEDAITRQATVNTGLAIKNTNSIAATDFTDEIMPVKLPDGLVCWPVLFAGQPPSGDENPTPMTEQSFLYSIVNQRGHPGLAAQFDSNANVLRLPKNIWNFWVVDQPSAFSY